MKKRWIGPPNPGPDGEELGHDIRVGGQAFGTVKPGEVIDVPDELAAEASWSADLWEDVKASGAKKSGSEG